MVLVVLRRLVLVAIKSHQHSRRSTAISECQLLGVRPVLRARRNELRGQKGEYQKKTEASTYNCSWKTGLKKHIKTVAVAVATVYLLALLNPEHENVDRFFFFGDLILQQQHNRNSEIKRKVVAPVSLIEKLCKTQQGFQLLPLLRPLFSQ